MRPDAVFVRRQSLSVAIPLAGITFKNVEKGVKEEENKILVSIPCAMTAILMQFIIKL